MDHSRYYALEVLAGEWQFVIRNLIRRVTGSNEAPSSEDAFYAWTPQDTPVFYLSKETFPADLIAAAIGSTPEAVASAKVIRLKSLAKGDVVLPKPTHPNLWGEA